MPSDDPRSPVGYPQRRLPRVPLLADAWVLDGQNRKQVSTTDLSSGGLKLTIPGNPWRPHERLDVVLRLPDVTTEVVVQCKVAWASESALGAAFVGLQSETSKVIDDLVEKILADMRSFADEDTPVVSPNHYDWSSEEGDV